jgi:hypothetical protein
MPRRFGARIGQNCVAVFRTARELTAREKKHLLREILQVRGLMPLLMKQRNTGKWTIEERGELRAHLRRLSSLSPYLVVVVLPGSFIMLPALAWWLDRRRNRTGGAQSSEQRPGGQQ